MEIINIYNKNKHFFKFKNIDITNQFINVN